MAEEVKVDAPPLTVVRREMPSLAPRNFAEAITFAKMLEQSSFIPKEFRGRPGDILAAIQFGFELGVGPMQALQNIAVINGKPSVYGDLALALVQASGKLDYIEETDDGREATCKVKRLGEPNEHVVTFSDDDAKAAGLFGKQGPWTQYRKRMRMFRARGFALRDKFADVLKGLITREEAEDYPIQTPQPALPPPVAAIEDEPQTPPPPVEPRDPKAKSNLEERTAFLAHIKQVYPDKAEGDAWLKQQFEDRAITKWGQVTVGILAAMEADLRGEQAVEAFLDTDASDPSDTFKLQGE